MPRRRSERDHQDQRVTWRAGGKLPGQHVRARKYDLAPGARERLAKPSGILLAHPGLKLAIEGLTDNTGSDDFNMKLSDQRANAVRDYLMQQGLSGDSIIAKGMGKADPAADNATAEGRKQNRRVEIIVSGEAIGTKIG